MIELIPFPIDHYRLLWAWLNEYPHFNFDDSGPKTPMELRANLISRLAFGECLQEVLQDGIPVGAFSHMRKESGRLFRGICFTSRVHGRGVAYEAVRLAIRAEFESGATEFTALYFADNVRVDRFLAKFGAVEEGQYPSQVLRNGTLVYWKRVVITADAFREHHRSGPNQERPVSATDLRSVA